MIVPVVIAGEWWYCYAPKVAAALDTISVCLSLLSMAIGERH